jgi:CRISPR-associated protein Cas2
MPEPILMRYLVCYDIPSDRRRLRVARALEAYGFRVQYSVFECELNRALLQEVNHRLGRLIEHASDSVRIYPLCTSCAHGCITLGTTEPVGLNDPFFLFEG